MSRADITITFSVEGADPGFIVDMVADIDGCIEGHLSGYGLRSTSAIVTSVKNSFGEAD